MTIRSCTQHVYERMTMDTDCPYACKHGHVYTSTGVYPSTVLDFYRWLYIASVAPGGEIHPHFMLYRPGTQVHEAQ